MSLITNRQLFSAVYLRELQQSKHTADVLEGARQTIRDWRDEYKALDTAADCAAYAKQCLSALGLAVLPYGEHYGFTLYADATKVQATGLCLVVEDTDLGRTVKGAHPQARLVRELRRASLQWGILTNGIRWRLCHAVAPAAYEVYLEADLDGLLKAANLHEFLIFHRFFGCEAFSNSPEQVGLTNFLAESDKRTEAIERHLKSRVEPILQKLCLGFVQDEAAGSYSTESLQVIYQNAIYLLYRILFLFYAEARGLLPVKNARYQPAGLASLVEAASKHQQEGVTNADLFSLWKRLTHLFVVVDDGDEELGVAAYNGGLFSDTEKPYLKNHKIRNDYLASALFALGFEETKHGFQAIDYRDLSVRHLGTLYEGLLEYRLNLVEGEPRVVRESNGKRVFLPLSKAGAVKKGEMVLEVGEVYFADDKGERKASGSYYTPEDVVQYIVGNTVTPKLVERREPIDAILAEVERERAIAPTPEQRGQLERYADQKALETVEQGILRLRILDPAMGSGHFLVAAAQTVSDFIIETLNATDWPNESISTDPLFWKRRVVERCIYGVDKNPLAHELAKLSLWITSASAGKPLTFLDHHLKVGNSLYGTPFSRLANLPTAKKQTDDPLFRIVREQTIGLVLKELTEITQTDSDTIETVKHKGEINRTARAFTERLRTVADLWLATLFDLKTEGGRAITDEEYARFLNDLTSNYADEAWQHRFQTSHVLQAARRIAKHESFFHWELEFPDAVVNGECCFDVVVANPPYVGTKANAAITALYETAKCSDLYAWLFEQSLEMTCEQGVLGTIIPLSLTFSSRLEVLRGLLLKQKGILKLATFDNIPDCIFNTRKQGDNTNKANSQRTTIVLFHADKSRMLSVQTTDFLRWKSEERTILLSSLHYADSTSIVCTKHFPKVGIAKLVRFWQRLHETTRSLADITASILGEGQRDDAAPFVLVVPRAIRYFMSAVPIRIDRNKALTLTFSSQEQRDLAMVLLNSNIHYWYWRACGDGFATNADVVASFPAPCLPIQEVRSFAQRINEKLPDCLVFKMNSGLAVPNYNLNLSMDTLLDIDEWIVRHVAPDLNLPRDIFAQYKSNSFLHPLDLSALMGATDEEGGE